MTFDEFIEEWNSPEKYILARTSGSTGTPKEIKLAKTFVKRRAEATNSFFGLSSGSRFHSCVGADFIGGKMMLVRAMLAGGKFTWEVPSNRPLQAISSNETIDLLAVVPSQMLHILSNMKLLPELRNIIIGGSSIHPELRKNIAESSLVCYETYGMTETSSHIALRRIVPAQDVPFHTIGDVIVSADDRGCLVIDFPGGEQVITNDLAKIISPSEFFILGRVDDIIVTGGKKVNPAEVEIVLSELSRTEVTISSIPDKKWGEKVVAVVRGYEDVSLVTNSINESKLPNWQRPKDVIVVSIFPRTPNGKIDRKKLREILYGLSIE